VGDDPGALREVMSVVELRLKRLRCALTLRNEAAFLGAQMSYGNLALAALGATVAYFAFGFLLFFLAPALIKEAHKYPAVYRRPEEMKTVMPFGLVATYVAIFVVAMLFALIHPAGVVGVADGARFGALIGVFVVCGFVLHNYVNLNIGLTLVLEQAVAYFFQWTVVGMVISLIYKPALIR
jgi:hypothetical protein